MGKDFLLFREENTKHEKKKRSTRENENKHKEAVSTLCNEK